MTKRTFVLLALIGSMGIALTGIGVERAAQRLRQQKVDRLNAVSQVCQETGGLLATNGDDLWCIQKPLPRFRPSTEVPDALPAPDSGALGPALDSGTVAPAEYDDDREKWMRHCAQLGGILVYQYRRPDAMWCAAPPLPVQKGPGA